MTSPVVVQENFRARNDNGSETSATWAFNLNTNWTQDTGVTFRVRFTIAETNARNHNGNFTLYASKNGGGYSEIGIATTNIKLVDSTNVTDDEVTTQQISTGTFVAGRIDENNTVTTVLINNSKTEMEYVLQLNYADLAQNDTIALRVYSADAVLNTYTNTPTITVNMVAQSVEETATAAKSLGVVASSNEIGYQSISEQRTLGVGVQGGKVIEETLYDVA